ncbi:uncharacterized protein LOC143511766 [Brachyhypopomus gauderio]|uniref:uncharacterized protein LOC143511766 n=1 Tax=Brachyhypopomus gauderio TaxID=698409 RepID=UPI0040415032
MSYQTDRTSSASESCSTGAYSLGSLENPPREQRSERACYSQPFIKPYLKDQILTKIFKRLPFKILSLKESNLPVLPKDPQKHEQTDFSIEDARCFLRYLAAELDRIVQLRDVTIMSGVSNGEINEEEGCTLILQWVEELRYTQQTSQQPMKVPGKLKAGADPQASERSDMQQKCADEQHRLNDGKRILSDWIREFKRGSQDLNRLLFTAEQQAVIKDLVKQWKKGQLTNMLPVMDLIIRNIMLKDKSEESLLKLWFKTEQRFKKGGDMHVPAPAWKWIMKSSDQVILDPSTANPTLVLSQDGRSVRTKTHEESDPWLSHLRKHHQYDAWPCVQAKKGYITGRHYWEVDVTGKCEWRLGVVQESAPRCGFINMNTTAGYWTLRLQLGSLMALTDPVTKLNQATPSKIGVFLDIKEGQLSFYDTEKRKIIFTFKTDFSKCGRIYPVFGTEETNRSLKII